MMAMCFEVQHQNALEYSCRGTMVGEMYTLSFPKIAGGPLLVTRCWAIGAFGLIQQCFSCA